MPFVAGIHTVQSMDDDGAARGAARRRPGLPIPGLAREQAPHHGASLQGRHRRGAVVDCRTWIAIVARVDVVGAHPLSGRIDGKITGASLNFWTSSIMLVFCHKSVLMSSMATLTPLTCLLSGPDRAECLLQMEMQNKKMLCA